MVIIFSIMECKTPNVDSDVTTMNSMPNVTAEVHPTSNISTFKGDIIYKPDGTAIIVENAKPEGKETLTKNIHREDTTSKPIPQTLQYVTIVKNSSSQQTSTEPQFPEGFNLLKTENNTEITQPVEHKFCLHTLSKCVSDSPLNVNNNNNNKDVHETEDMTSVFKRLLTSANQDYGLVDCKRTNSILMCFPCRLTFEQGSSYVSHASSDHGIKLNEMEQQLLGCEHIRSIIQETSNNKAMISFLEPIDSKPDDKPEIDKELENKTNTLEPHLEKTYTLSNLLKGSNANILSASVDDSENKAAEYNKTESTEDAAHSNAFGVCDVKMDNKTTDKQQNQQQIVEKVPKIEENKFKGGESEDKRINEAKKLPNIKEPKTKSPEDNSEFTQVSSSNETARHTSQSMATASESISSLALSSGAKNSNVGKMNESIFGGAGGVATVDPLFQMSLFQSRNSCKTLKCPRCNWHYKYRQTLDAHMKEKHSEETSDCLYCNANQPHPRLSRGESYACGYKPFKCEACNYSTTTKGNLSIHNQSDKHLFNQKTLQHQQQKEKMNGQSAGSSTAKVSNNQTSVNAIPARLLVEQQEQLQNLIQKQQMQQARKQSSPDINPTKHTTLHQSTKQKGSKEFSPSPANTSLSNRKATWRCDLCNYETDYSRNLRIHTQSEKHAHNAALARAAGKRRVDEIQNFSQDSGGESSGMEDQNDAKENETPVPTAVPMDQNSPNAMATLYYYLASLQSSMQGNQEKEHQNSSNLHEQEKQQKQLLAQQQQLILAQQYQHMLAQLSGSGDMHAGVGNPHANQSTAIIQQQQLLLQMQLWRQLLARGDGSQLPNNLLETQRNSDAMQDLNNSNSMSTKFLFTCGVCCNYSCNDLESLCSHVRTSRYPRTSLEESEWVIKSATDGYLCRICNYTTQLRTNFSLHCKTEKHTSKLQLINHIREGGESNEWKVSHAIAGNNMNKVTCNGCRHSTTSIDKLRIHCSTERHQGTLTMCHYLDTMLKDAELGKDLHSSDEISKHHLSCRPCAYQSKFVVEMIQHMQCQKHQVNVHQEQQRGGGNLSDMVAAEPDENDTKDDASPSEKSEEAGQSNDPMECSEMEDKLVINHQNMEVENLKCQLCKYETNEENMLQIHMITQHNIQSSIKCPMCPVFLSDVGQLQYHLIHVHKLTGEQESDTDPQKANNIITNSQNTTRGTLKVISPRRLVGDESRDAVVETSNSSRSLPSENVTVNSHVASSNADDSFSQQCKQCGDTLTTQEKWQRHMELHSIQSIAELSDCTVCENQFSTPDELREHMQTKHQKEEDKQRGKIDDACVINSVTSVHDNERATTIGNGDTGEVCSDPRRFLKRVCEDGKFFQKTLNDHRFDQIWSCLEPPFTCSLCEETFVSKSDLMKHLMTSSSHKYDDDSKNAIIPNSNQSDSQQNDENGSATPLELCDNRDKSDQLGQEQTGDSEGKHDAESSNFDFSLLSEYKWKRGRLLYPGISKITHKKVLVNVGLDQVAHFVENRTSSNREKALKWKRENAGNIEERENDRNSQNAQPIPINNSTIIETESVSESSTPMGRPSSPFSCSRCGKGFSNMWILKVHQKSVHNMDMSSEMLEEFVNKYSSWYWECAKKEMKEASNVDLLNSKRAQYPSANDTSKRTTTKDATIEPVGSSNPSKVDDNNNFQQAALQTLLKNYPGLLGSHAAAMPAMPQLQQNTEDDQSKLQQQMLMQMMIAAQAQAQATLQQQQHATALPQDSNQANAPNIMNVLVDHIYGAALHGATPGFMDPVGVMSLLQQQNRMPSPGMNPYQLLAMRFAQQQQQMQQMLMYPTLAGNTAGMPFMQSLTENTNQQQMLASFAASLLSPGMSSDATQGMINNPVAAALQAYQMQANATSAATSSQSEVRTISKDQDQDFVKVSKVTQRESIPVLSQTLQAAELPAKRPRTRITDDQLKVLRANFDINTSPSENQISEMAAKTGLPSKVIKHWFRNTLFKERQRSKDSPYNFNIPPMTSLDDVKKEEPESDPLDSEEITSDVALHKIKIESISDDFYKKSSQHHDSDIKEINQNIEEDNSGNQSDELHGVETISQLPIHPALAERHAMEILRSLNAGKGTSEEIKQSLFAMSLIPGLAHASNSGRNDMSLNHAIDINRGVSVEDDSNMTYSRESQNDSFGYERSPSDYSFPNSHGGISSISRRTPRTRFSDYQLKVLQDFFDKNAYPKDEDLDKLSRMLELSTRVIVVWFQNARQKARKSYEMQQGSMNFNHHSNSSMTRYPGRLSSPPSSPVQRYSPNPVSSHGSTTSNASYITHMPQYTLETVPKAAVKNLAVATTSNDVKRERSSSSHESDSYKCRQCDTVLQTAEDLHQHEAIHAAQTSSYMNSVLQQYKMFYPSIMVQGASKKDSPDVQRERDDRPRIPSRSSLSHHENEERRSSFSKDDGISEMTSQKKVEISRSVNDVMDTFTLAQSRNNNREKLYSYEPINSISGNSANNQMIFSSANPFNNSRDNMYATKRKMSISPTLSMSSSSSTSPNSARKNMARSVINDTSKDPKRLRTTITPEQLEFLYKQYLVDSSPSRKVIEQISEIVGLKKRVVQVWFQNTRARERKGQFRSVGRITSVLGVPQICPHCRVTFRTKADLDAHIRYRHMQSPSSVVPALPHTSPVTSFPEIKTSTRSRSPLDEIPTSSFVHGMTSLSDSPNRTALVDKLQDYKEIFSNLSKKMNEKKLQEYPQNSVSVSHPLSVLESTIAASLANKPISVDSDDQPSSPKKRKIFDEVPYAMPFVTTQSAMTKTSLPASLDVFPQHTFATKSLSVDVIAQKLQSKTASRPTDLSHYETTEGYPSNLLQNGLPVSRASFASATRSSVSPPVSSPESLSHGSESSPFMVPLKRHRTQMTSLQVRSLKHCFSEYKTPSLLECETLGEQIGLPKRVIQVWFQNARAKDKRAKQDDYEIDQSENLMHPGGSCRLCPDMRFGTLKEYRAHVFSNIHLQRFVTAYDGEYSDDQSRSSGRRTPTSDMEELASPTTAASVIERNAQQYFGSASISSHDVIPNTYRSQADTDNMMTASSNQESQSHKSASGWGASILANPDLLQKYQQFEAVKKLMNASSVQNGVDRESDSNTGMRPNASNDVLNALKQSWMQQFISTQAQNIVREVE